MGREGRKQGWGELRWGGEYDHEAFPELFNSVTGEKGRGGRGERGEDGIGKYDREATSSEKWAEGGRRRLFLTAAWHAVSLSVLKEHVEGVVVASLNNRV